MKPNFQPNFEPKIQTMKSIRHILIGAALLSVAFAAGLHQIGDLP